MAKSDLGGRISLWAIFQIYINANYTFFAILKTAQLSMLQWAQILTHICVKCFLLHIFFSVILVQIFIWHISSTYPSGYNGYDPKYNSPDPDTYRFSFGLASIGVCRSWTKEQASKFERGEGMGQSVGWGWGLGEVKQMCGYITTKTYQKMYACWPCQGCLSTTIDLALFHTLCKSLLVSL